MSFDEKYKFVRQWLHEIFNGSVPQFEISTYTIDTLYKLMEKNKKVEADLKIQREDLIQKRREYKAEGERIEKLLEHLNISENTLSNNCLQYVKHLQRIALALDVKDCSNECLTIAIANLSQQIQECAIKKRRKQFEIAALQNKTKQAQVKVSALENHLSTLEKQNVTLKPTFEKKQQQAGFFRGKAKEYHSSAVKCKNKLPATYVDHKFLLQRQKDLQKLNNKLAPLKAKLETYSSLPPDVPSTRLKIEELRRDMDNLDEEFETLMKQVS